VLLAQVFIYSPARTASQQGKALNGTWKLAFGEGERCVCADATTHQTHAQRRSRRKP
jgi:hypothetical protein